MYPASLKNYFFQKSKHKTLEIMHVLGNRYANYHEFFATWCIHVWKHHTVPYKFLQLFLQLLCVNLKTSINEKTFSKLSVS